MTCCFAWCCCGKRENKGDKHGGTNDRTDTRRSDAVPVPNGNGSIQARSFQFRELASATRNFTSDYLLGEGGFGRVYKGCLDNTEKIVAVKQLDRNSLHGNREFLVEVLMLSLLRHPNLVKLVGYCADGDQRHLVYEYMNNGSLQDHLFDLQASQTPLNWYTRMKIAYGAAQGLEYLHDKANPPVIYGDLKSCNILLDNALNPKLSDFGLAKLGPMGDMPVASSRVKGTYGYCAPEYARGGQISLKSDVYSFGVVLLELLTGRRALDTSKLNDEQNLVSWAQPKFKDQQRYTELVDPLLENNYPIKGLNQAVAIAAMCLQEEPSVRPFMSDVVVTLSFLIQEEEPSTSTPQQTTSAPDQIEILSHRSRSSLSSSYTESIGDHVIETVELDTISRNIDDERSLRSSSRSSNGSGGEGDRVREGSVVSLSEKSGSSSSSSSSFKSLKHSPSPSMLEGDYTFDGNK